jgi:membrane-bound lytic murein transglycosylase D
MQLLPMIDRWSSVARPLTVVVALASAACAGASRGDARVTPTAGSIVQAGGSDSATARAFPPVTAADLDRRTAELFGEELRLDATVPVPLDTVMMAGGDDEPSWDIDVRSYETFDRVRFYVNMFSGNARPRFAERLSAGTRYEAMIRAKLRAGALPEDMYYLALVESGYNPHAYSRAAAVGMWQFMTTTAKGMGLRVDWWVDERRDPVRSTDAAVRFLRGLNEQFGSMYLAAAAYNGGPGRIARGLNRYADDLEGATGDDMFFALAEKKYLKGETSNYVPQLIAAALVAKEPDRYGLVIEQRSPFAYDSVWVGGRVPLTLIANASGSTLASIQELNPHMLRGMTPPMSASDSIKVRIPTGTRAQFDSMYALLPAEERLGARTIRAEKNATWATIAKPAKITAKALALYNPKVKPSKTTGRIPQGTPIVVPIPMVVAAALNVPDPAVERYGSGTRTHVVRQGENLSVIAKRYKTTPAAIMRLNRLKKPMIFPGQELLVNGAARPAARPATKKATPPKR